MGSWCRTKVAPLNAYPSCSSFLNPASLNTVRCSVSLRFLSGRNVMVCGFSLSFLVTTFSFLPSSIVCVYVSVAEVQPYSMHLVVRQLSVSDSS